MQPDALQAFVLLNSTDTAVSLIEDIVETKETLTTNFNFLNEKQAELKTETRVSAAIAINENVGKIRNEALRSKSRLVRYLTYLDREQAKLESVLAEVELMQGGIVFKSAEQETGLAVLLGMKKALLESIKKYKPDIEVSLRAISDFEDYTIFAIMESASKVNVKSNALTATPNNSKLSRFKNKLSGFFSF